MSRKNKTKEEIKTAKAESITKKEDYRKLIKQFLPLIIAVVLWFITISILHIPSIKDNIAYSLIKFTFDSAIGFGELLFIPIKSEGFPNISVSGYTMQIVVECTAYNFYVFVFFLGLLSPVSIKQRLLTMVIFLGFVFIINNIRFFTMGVIGNNFPDQFHYIHDYLWNILFGFLVFLIWAWRYKDPLK